MIWNRFLAFNRARGNDKVPAGFLLGFMHRWRTSPGAAVCAEEPAAPLQAQDLQERDFFFLFFLLHNQIKAAPIFNRQLHGQTCVASSGKPLTDARVLDAIRLFGCPRFTATLAVHVFFFFFFFFFG